MKSTLQNFPFNTLCDNFDYSIASIVKLTFLTWFEWVFMVRYGSVRFRYITMLVRVHVKMCEKYSTYVNRKQIPSYWISAVCVQDFFLFLFHIFILWFVCTSFVGLWPMCLVNWGNFSFSLWKKNYLNIILGVCVCVGGRFVLWSCWK